MRSCLIDGEAVCCNERGMATFQLLRHRRNEPQAFLYAFDLLELNGDDAGIREVLKKPLLSRPLAICLARYLPAKQAAEHRTR